MVGISKVIADLGESPSLDMMVSVVFERQGRQEEITGYYSGVARNPENLPVCIAILSREESSSTKTTRLYVVYFNELISYQKL